MGATKAAKWRNKSIEIVEQIHWNRWTNPLKLLNEINEFVSRKRRFRLLKLAEWRRKDSRRHGGRFWGACGATRICMNRHVIGYSFRELNEWTQRLRGTEFFSLFKDSAPLCSIHKRYVFLSNESKRTNTMQLAAYKPTCVLWIVYMFSAQLLPSHLRGGVGVGYV